MMQKTNQLKLITEQHEKIKYYCAFSYLSLRPLFKARLFEYFDYDIKRAFLADKSDIDKICEYYDIIPARDFIAKRDKIDIEKCYKDAFYQGIKMVTYEDDNYPELLRHIPDFPLSLYYKGNLDNVNYKYALAIVGSRRASTQARNALDSIVSNFKNSNIIIVSGLAYGIDAQAHQSALDNNLKTIAVIGSGLDITYPVQNKKLYQDIIDNDGAIISEYPLKTRPYASNFPQRNRIVVAMSKGTLVAEAQIKSGAMISANLTLDYNRELMCIPGNILNPNTSGIYELIKNGAGIVSCASDLLNLMGWDIILNEKENENDLDELQKKILQIVSIEPKTFDEIAFEMKMQASDIMVSLTELELKGLIKQSNNKYYKK